MLLQLLFKNPCICLSSAPDLVMRLVLILSTLLLLLGVPASCTRYDDFDDGEDLAEFDDNDFAEFEDMSEDRALEEEEEEEEDSTPSPRPTAPVGDEEDDEAVVELEDAHDDFEDAETPVR